MTSYINELRTFMIKFPWKLADAADECNVIENISTVKETAVWEKLSFEVNIIITQLLFARSRASEETIKEIEFRVYIPVIQNL